MRTPKSDLVAGWLAGSLAKAGTSEGARRGWRTRRGEMAAVEPERAGPRAMAAEAEGAAQPAFGDLKQVGGQRGSNPGGLFEDPATGEQYYVKVPSSEAHARNEVLAARLYQLAGVEVPDVQLMDVKGEPGVSSKIVAGLDQGSRHTDWSQVEGAHEGLAVDAWLANWDVVGLEFDNMLIGDDGRAVRLDTGGALDFRAMGAPKGAAFGDSVGELDTLRDRGLNRQSAAVFGGVSDEALEAGVRRVLAVTDEQIDGAVGELGPAGAGEARELARKLKARRDDLGARFPHLRGAGPSAAEQAKAIVAEAVEKAGTSEGALRGWKTRKKLLPPVGRKRATRMIRSAAEMAEAAHAGQTRGHGLDVPYFEHPRWIAGRLAERDDATPEMVAAAFLHDTVEDTDATLADVEAAAGPAVAELVDWLTDKFTREQQPGMNRAERKRRENARLAGAPREAKVIKLLDRLSNLGDMRAAKPRFQRVYADESEALLKDALAGADAGLEDEVREAIARLRQWSDEGMDDVPVPRAKRWVDHAPGMPHDTLAEHTGPDGRLTPERRVLHDRIVRDAIDRVPDTPAGATPVAILMVGTPGAGKSTLADGLAGGDVAHVEADLYKQQLPEYRASLEAGARDAGVITHAEGKHIAERVWAEALERNKSVLYDATGSWIGQYRQKIADLRERGYAVHLVMPDVTVDEALRRVRERFRATGRTIPERSVRSVAEHVAYNFRKLRHEVDGFMLFDNGGDAPRLVWEAKGGEETVHDEDYVSRFRQRSR